LEHCCFYWWDYAGGGAVLLWAALKALGGVWSACVCVVGLMAVLWAGAEECGSQWQVWVLSACCLLPAAWRLLMTSIDRNDLMPAQEKLEWVTPKIEWVTPKISLMDAGDTAGKSGVYFREPNINVTYGPS
jgi:hypothetical protein